MTTRNERPASDAAIRARRALLRRQMGLIANALPWLTDSRAIPDEAFGSAALKGDLAEPCYHLYVWMVAEIVAAAHRVRDDLHWEEAMQRHGVPSDLQPSVRRAVLEVATRYAPGISAIADIVMVTPAVAVRHGLPMSEWEQAALRAEEFAARFSVDGTHVQVLIRTYLQRKAPEPHAPLRSLDAGRLRLDATTGITSVTPIDDLVDAAKTAVHRHIGRPRGVCVAMQANVPRADGPEAVTFYTAVWRSFVAAAARRVFPTLDPARIERLPGTGPDPAFADALDRLARQRAAELNS